MSQQHFVQFAHGVLVKSDDHSQQVTKPHEEFSPEESALVNPAAEDAAAVEAAAKADGKAKETKQPAK